MAKVKERKSESWKPGLFHDDGFISKNKKRKDKRMSLNLSAKKIDTDEFIPIKKSALALGKIKDGLKSTPSKFSSPALDKKNTPKKKDTPLPASGGKKQNKNMSTPDARKFSLADTLSAVSRKLNGTPKLNAAVDGSAKKNKEVTGTPKVKPDLAKHVKVVNEPAIKSALKKKAQKFIDNEAEEGEEPITSKEVKPFIKGQKRKSISFKFNNQENDSEETDSSDDSPEEINGPRSFLDEEASEGEETDEIDSDESDDLEDDDDDGEDSDTFKNFLTGDSEDDESGEEEGSDVGDEEDSDLDDEEGSDVDDEENSDISDEEDDSDEEDEPPKLLAKKNAPVSQNKKNGVEEKQVKSKKSDVKAESKAVPVPVVPLNQNKKEKAEKSQKVIEPVAKKSKIEENAQKTKKEKKKSDEDTPAGEISEYAGFIKHLPSTITSDQIKATLGSAISPKNIVSVILKKNNKKRSNRGFVYVSDEDSLYKLENKVFTIGKDTFKIFKARESKKLVKNQPLIFLPRVPLSIDDEKVKKIIESDIGAGNVISLKRMRENDKLKTRNLIIEVPNEELMKKVILKGSYNYKGTDIIVRQAFESGFTIPFYRVVFSGIPENTNEAALKKAIESKIGQGTVLMVKFSFRTNKFAFVTVNNAESLNKLLEPSTKIAINKTVLQTLEFRPRAPKKRGPAKKKDSAAPAAKKQKTDETSPEPKSKKSKNKKKRPAETQPNSPQKTLQPPKSVQNAQKQKNRGPKQSLNNTQNSSPAKAKPQQQQSSPSPSSPSKNKNAKNQVPDKKNNLNQKVEAKKNKLKNKKNKKKQVNASD